MAEYIGETQLVEYVEKTEDGNSCKLMGWPARAIRSTQLRDAPLESCYPGTQATPPAGLVWRPYRLIKIAPRVSQPNQGQPFCGDLRYHKDVGWHYRYSIRVRITGRSASPRSFVTNGPLSSGASCVTAEKGLKKPRRLAKTPSTRGLTSGIPVLRLQRIESIPGFQGLAPLLEGRRRPGQCPDK